MCAYRFRREAATTGVLLRLRALCVELDVNARMPALDRHSGLVREAKANEAAFRARVRTVLRSSYSGHYRRIVPRLLGALELRCNNTEYRPVMDAVELLRRYAGRERVRRYETPNGYRWTASSPRPDDAHLGSMSDQLVLPCAACGPTRTMTVESERSLIVCATCRTRFDFVRSPLYLVTGAPTAGKTNVVQLLAASFDGLVIYDTDLFGPFAHPDWKAWANTWLLVAHGLAASGLSTALCGYGLNRPDIEPLAARQLLEAIHVLNLDLRDDELRWRLRERGGYDAERIERKVARAGFLRADADVNVQASTSPREVASLVAEWLVDHGHRRRAGR